MTLDRPRELAATEERAGPVGGTCAQHQRAVATAIKTARELALLPYSTRTFAADKPGGRGRGPGGGGRGRPGAAPSGDGAASSATPDAPSAVDAVSVDIDES